MKDKVEGERRSPPETDVLTGVGEGGRLSVRRNDASPTNSETLTRRGRELEPLVYKEKLAL